MKNVVEKIDRKMRQKILLFAIFIAVAIFWIPIAWKDEVEFNKVLFSNEYYGFGLDVVLLCITFWLANSLLEKLQRKRFDNDLEYYLANLSDMQKSLNELANSIDKKTFSTEIVTSSVKVLDQKSEIIRSYSKWLIEKYKMVLPPESIRIISSFEENIFLHIKDIVEEERKERILYTKKNEEVKEKIKIIYEELIKQFRVLDSKGNYQIKPPR